jgi:hypothetical protein
MKDSIKVEGLDVEWVINSKGGADLLPFSLNDPTLYAEDKVCVNATINTMEGFSVLMQVSRQLYCQKYTDRYLVLHQLPNIPEQIVIYNLINWCEYNEVRLYKFPENVIELIDNSVLVDGV